MKIVKKAWTLYLTLALTLFSASQAEAITYVTDTGGYAYDESRAATNIAPAIALGTVAIVGIIAVAVQNSHGSSSSHYHGFSSSSSSFSHYSSYSDYSYSSY